MSIRAFRKVQFRQEATRGSTVTATNIMPGTLLVNPVNEFHRPSDDDGSLAEFRRAVLTGNGAGLRFEGSATYEQIVHMLAMSTRGTTVSGVIEGGGPAYNWTFTPLLTVSNVIDSYTFEYGDDSQGFESSFCMARSWELGINLGDVLNLSIDMFGQNVTKKSIASLSLPAAALNEIVANNLTIFFNDTWANLGNTQRSNLVMGGTIRFVTGITPVKYADGTLFFTNVIQQKRHLEIELELAMGANAMTEYDKWIAQDLLSIRMLFTGAVDLDPSAGKHTFQIDAIGKYVSGPELFGDRDGQDTIRLVFHSHTDGTNEMEFRVRTITQDSSA